MKILRIRAQGLPLYQQTFDLTFFAAQRVDAAHEGQVTNLFHNICVNNAEAFVGLNASGKTSALNVVAFTFMLLNAMSLNNESVPKVLSADQPAIFDIDFYAAGTVYHLKSKIAITQVDGFTKVTIGSETLWKKSATTKVNKSNLFDWDGIEPYRMREDAGEYLPDDVSITIALIKQLKRGFNVISRVGLTNYNFFLPRERTVLPEIISILDPSIEYISVEESGDQIKARLKFFGKEELILNNLGEIEHYLSSGTIKGIGVFEDAIRMLRAGGYLIIDEIENHFNQELVASLLRLFLNEETNPNGAVLVFSTHYPELLDELERNDAVFITRHEQGLRIDNLSTLLSRNDLTKSDVYQSNYLGGTAPKFKTLNAFRKTVMAGVKGS